MLSVDEKINRAKIQIQEKNSFFAYLSLFLKFKEAKKGELPDYAGMGVNEKGDCYFSKKFVEEITKNDDTQMLEGVLVHEILHLALMHLKRLGGRDSFNWNLATDLVVNSLIIKNNFKLPEGCLIPNYNNEITLFKKTPDEQIIKNCNKRIAEEIYDEIKLKNNKNQFYGGQFDAHLETTGLSEKEKKELENEWGNRIYEALNVSRMKGDVPKGIELLLGKLHEEKINWKVLLQRYIVNQLPFDYSWEKPNKKSVSVGVYLPYVLKEKIDVVIGIDVSGSIGQKELTDFLSEIIGIAKAFQERIDMKLITHEVNIVNEFEIKNGNIEKIKNLKINGGGGTAHHNLFNHIKEKIRNCKCGIFLTDGYSDLDKIKFGDYNFDKFFVISKSGEDKQLKNKECQIIHLKN